MGLKHRRVIPKEKFDRVAKMKDTRVVAFDGHKAEPVPEKSLYRTWANVIKNRKEHVYTVMGYKHALMNGGFVYTAVLEPNGVVVYYRLKMKPRETYSIDYGYHDANREDYYE